MFENILKNSGVRNVLMIMSGTGIAQALSFILMPVISRLYSPDDFGVLGAFSAITSVFCAASTLQYSQALVLPKRVSDGVNVFALSILAVFAFGVISLFTVVSFPQVVLGFLGSDSIVIAWFLALSIIFNGLNQALQGWCVRRKAFKRTSVSPIVRSVSSGATQISFGYLGFGGAGLVGATLLGDIAANFSLMRQLLVEDRRVLFRLVNWPRMKALAWKYREFTTFVTAQNVMSALSIGLPVVFLAYFFDSTVAGYYALGLRVLQTPLTLISSSVRQVVFQKASELYNVKQRILPLYVQSTLTLFTIALIPALICFLWGGYFFGIFFGDKWIMAGNYASWLIIWIFFSFCFSASSSFSIVLQKQRFIFFSEAIVLIIRLSIMLYGCHFLSSIKTVIYLSIASAIMSIFINLKIYHFISSSDAQMINK